MNILVVDDHQLFVDGLRHLVKKLHGEAKLTECSHAKDAIGHLDKGKNFDLILADLNLPDLDGFSIIKRAANHDKSMPVIAISADNDVALIQSVIKAGANGFIPKSYSGEDFLKGIRHVLNGEVYVPRHARGHLEFAKLKNGSTDANFGYDDLRRNRLTQRQIDILELLGRGYSNKQIATSLNIAENTVKVHLTAIYQLLDVSSRTMCVKVARERGLID